MKNKKEWLVFVTHDKETLLFGFPTKKLQTQFIKELDESRENKNIHWIKSLEKVELNEKT